MKNNIITFVALACFAMVASAVSAEPSAMAKTKVTGIYAPPNGQSNAAGWKNAIGDGESGASVLRDDLEEVIGKGNVITLLRDADRKPFTPALGSSTVDAKTTSLGDKKIWWYIEEDRPGGAMMRSLKIMKEQNGDMVAKKGKGVVIKMPWSQGESNTTYASGKEGALQDEVIARYKYGTKKVFDYIQAQLGVPIDFFIVKTSFIDVEGAKNDGATPQQIQALLQAGERIRQAQDELIAENDNVYFGADPIGLATARDYWPKKMKADRYHYSPETYEVLGRRVAKEIIKQMGL